MKVVILGGGPTGLGLAHGIAGDKKNKPPFVLLERLPRLGGLAQTLTWDKHGTHDLGPHKIFTTDKDLWNRIWNLLEEKDWLVRPKKSRIFLGGHFLNYPPSPFALAGIYGLPQFAKMCADYGVALVGQRLTKKKAESFKDDLVRRVGHSLYSVMFEPIAKKIWGDPETLDPKLSQGRIQTPSVVEVLAQVAGLRKKSSFEALEFHYPKGGLNRLWDSIKFETEDQGEFKTRCEVQRCELSNGRITEIRYKDLKSGEEHTLPIEKDDFVFSSLPLSMLPKLIPGAISASSKKLMDQYIKLNDLKLVFLKVENENAMEDSWIFVPDPKICFHRISEQESFDPSMTPGGSILCAEIMLYEGKPEMKLTDEQLIARVIEDSQKLGLKLGKVIASKVIPIPSSYPVYVKGVEPALAKILKDLDAIENFRTVGRQGAFNYIGTLDSMDIGYGAARWFNESWAPGRGGDAKKTASRKWTEERDRTSHYPVLD